MEHPTTTTPTARRIIVAQEHHSTRYWDASTLDAWAASAVAMLTERDADGWWYEDPAEGISRLPPLLTDEHIEQLPTPSLREHAREEQRDARRRHDQHAAYTRWYARMRAIVDTQDHGTVAVNGRGEREPRAWLVLRERDRFDDEGVELVDVESGLRPAGA